MMSAGTGARTPTAYWLITLIAVAMAILWSGPTRAADPVVVRTNIVGEGDIWVGQRVLLEVDILARDGWAQIMSLDSFEAPGAIVVRYETQGTRLNETIEGDSYTGQRYAFSVFPQQAGAITVPPTPVDVEVKTWGAGASSSTRRMQTPSVSFTARVPPGTEGIRGLISTTSLTAEQKWKPRPDSVKVGDALKRTVTMRADDVSGMAFTPLEHPEIGGVGLYPGEPSVDDRFERGSLSGTRIETVTYVFEREGPVEVPEIVVSWWDLRNQRLRHEVLAGLELVVAPGLVAEPETTEVGVATTTRRPVPRSLVLAVVLVIAVAIVIPRLIKHLAPKWTAWRLAQRETESAYFGRFARAARSNDPAATYNEIMKWLARIHEGPGAPRLDTFLDEFGDESARTETQALMRALDKREFWNGKELAGAIKAARRRWLASKHHKATTTQLLPPLNP